MADLDQEAIQKYRRALEAFRKRVRWNRPAGIIAICDPDLLRLKAVELAAANHPNDPTRVVALGEVFDEVLRRIRRRELSPEGSADGSVFFAGAALLRRGASFVDIEPALVDLGTESVENLWIAIAARWPAKHPRSGRNPSHETVRKWEAAHIYTELAIELIRLEDEATTPESDGPNYEPTEAAGAALEAVSGDGALSSNLKRLIEKRPGAGWSLLREEGEIDERHHYEIMARVDFLDYRLGDFRSARRLAGTNESTSDSIAVPYVECSENLLTFRDTEVRAFDTRSRRSLDIRPLDVNDTDEPRRRHAFEIVFSNPIPPGGRFDIVFYIALPGELRHLAPGRQIMTISTTRAPRGIDRLDFSVCLNYKPDAAFVDRTLSDDSRVRADGRPPTPRLYRPRTWWEKQFNPTDWTDDPWIVAWSTENPQSKLYVIDYGAPPQEARRRARKQHR